MEKEKKTHPGGYVFLDKPFDCFLYTNPLIEIWF